jgi:hypothetical protein
MKNLLLAVITTALITACANTELATQQIDNAAMKQAAETNITPEKAVENAYLALDKANQNELAFYTPLHFNGVQKSFDKIALLQKQKSDPKEESNDKLIITEAFKTQKLIDEASQVKVNIEHLLEKSLSHKLVLDQLNSKKVFPKQYKNINNDLVDLFKLIEQNRIDKALKNQDDLLDDMTELEIDTLINNYVKPAVLILDKAEDFDADDYAEKTFKQAELSIEHAEDFIANNPRDIEGIKIAGDEALLAAKRALNVGQFSKSLVELDEERAEIKALEMEDLLGAIITGFNAKNLEGLTLDEQSQELAQLARVQAAKLQALQLMPDNNSGESNSVLKSDNTGN